MKDCWSFPCCLSWTLDSLSKCIQLSLFYRYYFRRCSTELAQLLLLPHSRERSTFYSDRLPDFSLSIPRCYKDVYVNSFFPHTARLWNSLPIKCFPLTYDLNWFFLLMWLCISINLPYDHAWNYIVICRLAPRYYMEILDELQKCKFRFVSASLAASVVHLVHCQSRIQRFFMHTVRCKWSWRHCNTPWNIHFMIKCWWPSVFYTLGCFTMDKTMFSYLRAIFTWV